MPAEAAKAAAIAAAASKRAAASEAAAAAAAGKGAASMEAFRQGPSERGLLGVAAALDGRTEMPYQPPPGSASASTASDGRPSTALESHGSLGMLHPPPPSREAIPSLAASASRGTPPPPVVPPGRPPPKAPPTPAATDAAKTPSAEEPAKRARRDAARTPQERLYKRNGALEKEKASRLSAAVASERQRSMALAAQASLQHQLVEAEGFDVSTLTVSAVQRGTRQKKEAGPQQPTPQEAGAADAAEASRPATATRRLAPPRGRRCRPRSSTTRRPSTYAESLGIGGGGADGGSGGGAADVPSRALEIKQRPEAAEQRRARLVDRGVLDGATAADVRAAAGAQWNSSGSGSSSSSSSSSASRHRVTTAAVPAGRAGRDAPAADARGPPAGRDRRRWSTPRRCG